MHSTQAPRTPIRQTARDLTPSKIVWLGTALAALCAAALPTAAAPNRTPPKAYEHATQSSPIAISQDDKLVWNVNPQDNTVSVVHAESYRKLATLRVGKEPQSVALDPNGRYAYVANAAGNSVSVIAVYNANPNRFNAAVVKEIKTGAEPWNIAVSPDGTRVFVANSNQDTVAVLNPQALQHNPIVGFINLRDSLCNDPDRNRRFLPRGLAVTEDNRYLYVSSFFAYTKVGGAQADDAGRVGAVCRVSIDTRSRRIRDYRPDKLITLAPQVTGFEIDSNGDGTADATAAFPNQLQSVAIWKDSAYLPNIAASPSGPLRFNVDTHAFVNRIANVTAGNPTDAGAINLHLGARDPEPGRKKLFFANVWAMAFAQQGGQDVGYVVSAGSDLLVKVNVNQDGSLANTVDANTTRYVDLNDPNNAATQGAKACKNPLGIAIRAAGDYAYVMCRVSKNVAVIDLRSETVAEVVRTGRAPRSGTLEEEIAVGAEMFFSSRGHFDRPPGTTVSTDERLSNEGWQNCASCHFEGLTDSVVWAFGTGPRKSVPLNGTFNPRNPEGDQRVLNYTAIFDEVEDFDNNIRNVSGPGNLSTPVACSDPAPGGVATSTFDPNHGLLIGDDGDLNKPPCTINAFAKPNAGRKEVTVTLPGSTHPVPALTALRKWVQFAVRTPNAPLIGSAAAGGVSAHEIADGRALFGQAGCASCHSGGKWTTSTKDFPSPPAVVSTEKDPNGVGVAPDPNGAQYLPDFLVDVGTFNLNVAGGGNELPGLPTIGGIEKDQAKRDALGKDHDGDGLGEGFNTPSLLGIGALPPFLHNGACETLTCVLADSRHRTGNGQYADVLAADWKRQRVIRFLEAISARTTPFALPR